MLRHYGDKAGFSTSFPRTGEGLATIFIHQSADQDPGGK